jgi:hypothetical protein
MMIPTKQLLTFSLVAALAACAQPGDVAGPEDEVLAPATDPAAPAASEEDEDEASARAGWKKADLTNFTSYPDPDSEECEEYNGCTWAGYFAFVNGKKSENWVKNHNIVAVHQKHANKYKLKTLRLKKGGDQIDVKVYDMCADSDCDGCCTQNSKKHGFLIDIESYTMDRFGHGDGTVEWKCLDCTN